MQVQPIRSSFLLRKLTLADKIYFWQISEKDLLLGKYSLVKVLISLSFPNHIWKEVF